MCDICGYIGTCHPRCPNWEPPKTYHYCSICNEGIYNGEEYIENMNGEYMHYDCIPSTRDLLEWLGCDIKCMDNDPFDDIFE